MATLLSFFNEVLVNDLEKFLQECGWTCTEGTSERPNDYAAPNSQEWGAAMTKATLLMDERGAEAQDEIAELMRSCGWTCTKN